MGGAIGDGYGGPFEGQKTPIVEGGQAWRLSDDTQLTLATCEALIETRGVVEPQRIAERFAVWHRESKVTGMGASTFKALSELVHGAHWALVGAKGERAAGNGAAMRIAPLAFLLNPEVDTDRSAIRDVSRITHHHDEAYVGALAIVAAVRASYGGHWTGDDLLISLVTPLLPDSVVRDRLELMAASAAGAPIQDIARQHGRSGYVAESVPLSIHAAQQVKKCGFEKTLQHLAAAGGDTDSNCAMAGQIMGAWLGYDQIPTHLLEQLPERVFIEDTANRFADVVLRRER